MMSFHDIKHLQFSFINYFSLAPNQEPPLFSL
jgi:hypothetical protein